nr:MAG TPA: hypothetical protein [Caudoviricetes sp.]
MDSSFCFSLKDLGTLNRAIASYCQNILTLLRDLFIFLVTLWFTLELHCKCRNNFVHTQTLLFSLSYGTQYKG